MRIIAGTLKGRQLKTPDWDGLRPTSDKLRETLFNVLGDRIVDARVVDGYAGTGAVGLEALSRGAAHVTFIENDRRAQRLIEANLHHCGVAERYAIIRVDFARAARQPPLTPVEIMFLDPPYGSSALHAALEHADRLSSAGARIIVEHAKRDPPPPRTGGLVLTRDLVSGDSGLAFYQKGEGQDHP
jgi:16S rRNA (guanine966-N2)-methyltransferase